MRLLTFDFVKSSVLFAVAFACALVATSQAHANTRVCASLKAQLANASSSGGGNAAQYNRYNAALTKQTRELKKTQSMARRGGCARNNTGQCRQINAAIPKMQANIAKLRSTRDRFAGKASGPSANQLRAKLRANGCDRQVLFPTNTQKQKSAVQSVSVPAQKKIINRSPGSVKIAPPPVPQNLTSGVRTLCVRTCDGYFFPVSFSADTSQVKRDEAACASMCPGTETKLYMHSVPEEETEAMVSISGERYVDTPTAFAYLQPGHLKKRAASCTCRAQQTADANPDQSPVPPGLLQTKLLENGTKTALPAIRPDIHADPDTQSTLQGGFTAQLMATLLDGVGDAEPMALVQNDAVRVVLPEFLPAPEEAKGLQAQVPTRVQ